MRYKQIATVGTVLISILILLAALMYYFNQGHCPKYTFQCENSTKCLTHRDMCNNIRDCDDGFDEKNCVDSNPVLWESFSPKRTECPEYAGNHKIEYDNNCLYKKCKVLCEKFSGPRIPNFFARKHVLTITLTKSSLPILRGDFFADYVNSKQLNLMKNQIQFLEPGAFGKQKYLSWLDLSHNMIEQLLKGHLVGLHCLKNLLLENNKIYTIDLRDLENSTTLEVLELSKNQLKLSNLKIPYLPALKELNLNDNELESITDQVFAGLPMLQELNLENNLIQRISPLSFQNLNNLILLNLMNNSITKIPLGLFDPLGNLSTLYVGQNPIRTLTASTFYPLKAKLISLNVEGIELLDGEKYFFNTFTQLNQIYFEKFHYCTSYAPQVPICHPVSDGISSLSHLLSTPLLRTAVWGISCATFLGNALVLWGRFTARDENRVLSIIIRNLAVSDLLMGLYLFIIGLEDIRFRENYKRQEAKEWMSSWSCTFIGMLAMISSEVSVLILSFMSIERYMLIATPLKGYRAVTPQTATSAMIIVWIIGVILATIPAIHWRSSTRFYGLNGMCFPLHIDDPFIVGWEYSAFIFLGVNLFGLVTIVYVYIGMFISIWRTRHATPLAVGDSEFALRFFFILLTDIVCWAPIIVLKIMALAQYPVAPELHAWVVVFILPVNSAVNPLLYTFTTPKFRERLSEGWFSTMRNVASRRSSRSGSQSSKTCDKKMTTITPNTKLYNQNKLAKPSLHESLLIDISTKDN